MPSYSIEVVDLKGELKEVSRSDFETDAARDGAIFAGKEFVIERILEGADFEAAVAGSVRVTTNDGTSIVSLSLEDAVMQRLREACN